MSEAMDGRQAARIPSIAPDAAAAAGLAAGVSFLAAAFTAGDERRAVLFGAGAAIAGAIVALAGIAAGVKKGINGLLLGFGAGFFARMITVAAGLIASGAKGHAALLYAATFFAVYAVTQAAEIAFVWASSRARTAAKV